MKTMLVSDLLVARNLLLQLLGICIVVGLVMCYAMETTVGGIAAVAAMAPLIYLFTMAGLDEQNNWERFRLTLPMSRRQVVLGRYLSLFVVSVATTAIAFLAGVLIAAAAEALADGQPDNRFTLLSFAFNPPEALLASVVASALVILLSSSIALPLIARFGMTRAARFVPLAFVILIAAAIGFFGDNVAAFDILANLDAAIDAGDWSILGTGIAAISAAALIIYIVSALIAVKLYEQREF